MASFITRGLTIREAAQFAVVHKEAECLQRRDKADALDKKVEEAIAQALSLRASQPSQETAEATEHKTLVPKPLTTPTASAASWRKGLLSRASSRVSRVGASIAAVIATVGIGKNRSYPVPPPENCYHGSAMPWIHPEGRPLLPGDTVQITGPLFVATKVGARSYASGQGVSITNTATAYNPEPGVLYRFRIVPENPANHPMKRGLFGGQFYCDATPQNPVTIVVEEVHLVEKVPYENSAAAVADKADDPSL